jgi:glycine cleavage system H lipoate-binding protein
MKACGNSHCPLRVRKVAMPIILAFLTFLIFIGISCLSAFIKKRFLVKVAEGPVFLATDAVSPVLSPLRTVAILPALEETTARIEGYAMPECLYYHQGHAWVAIQGSDTALIGIDEFASKFVGRATSIIVPKVGESFRQGEKGWILRRNGKEFHMVFPADGKVIAVNEQALENPEILSKEPYGKGWLMMIESKNLKRNLRNLLRGSVAKRWMEESAAELRSVFSGKLGVVCQDGGLPTEGLADHLDGAEWRDLASRIFMVESMK